MSNQEQDRLKRLREKQIADRDPQVKQRKVQWKDLPHTIRTPFYALLLGIVIIFALPTLWDSPYAIWVALLITVILILFGLIVGNSLDLRDDIRDKLK